MHFTHVQHQVIHTRNKHRATIECENNSTPVCHGSTSNKQPQQLWILSKRFVTLKSKAANEKRLHGKCVETPDRRAPSRKIRLNGHHQQLQRGYATARKVLCHRRRFAPVLQRSGDVHGLERRWKSSADSVSF